MDIFSFISLLGGLAFFLYGMKVMSDGLEKASNGKINNYLKKATENRFVAMLFGVVMTISLQSSSAVTVMLVGLVNSGILEFGQTIGVLMGSNIGTTLTAWILSLAGIDSEIVWLNLLKPANFSPLFALIGVVLLMASKKETTHSVGNVLIGFAVLMFGMNLMSGSMEPLAEMPEFANILTAFKNPLLAVAVGAIFTGVIQSSAASVAILQALSLTGSVTYGMAIPIIMGQNIGTCVTALISSIGVNRNAKKVAVVHLSFNIIGTLICLVSFCIYDAIFNPAFTELQITPFMIAIVHSIFNVVTTIILLPFTKELEKLANKIIPDEEKVDNSIIKLDSRLLTVPSMAVQRSFDAVVDMCKLANNVFVKAVSLTKEYNHTVVDEISLMEIKLDEYEDQIGAYMMKLSKIGVSDADSKSVAKILHTIDDFERIGDHAVELCMVVKEMQMKQVCFSDKATYELSKVSEAVNEIVCITAKAFESNDWDRASDVEPLEQVIGKLILDIRRNHIARVQRGECTIELGFPLSDILTCYSRVSNHCTNIAVAILESQQGTFETHEYIDSIRVQGNTKYLSRIDDFSRRFSLT